MKAHPSLATAPASSRLPRPCPHWCDSPHRERNLDPDLSCHSARLAISADEALTVWLQQTEDHTQLEPISIGVDTGPRELTALSADQLDDYAATLHRAAIRARSLLSSTHPATSSTQRNPR